ncbi:hypothetical protein F4810DRAFT_673882 [Camillea tinctor]|nr:hypothetical protein F4810DRAFT_673882 [Camillea tinctor]
MLVVSLLLLLMLQITISQPSSVYHDAIFILRRLHFISPPWATIFGPIDLFRNSTIPRSRQSRLSTLLSGAGGLSSCSNNPTPPEERLFPRERIVCYCVMNKIKSH